MDEVAELTRPDCVARLAAGVVGRLAVATPSGPHIAAVPYLVVEDAVVVRTTPYSLVGTHGRGAQVAFEVDHLDTAGGSGWTVVVRGRAEPVTDEAELRRLSHMDPPGGPARRMHLKLRLGAAEVHGTTVGLPEPRWRLASATTA